jgi:hypothetical protein
LHYVQARRGQRLAQEVPLVFVQQGERLIAKLSRPTAPGRR